MNILLGSGSPRRKELLTGLDIPFTIVKISCDESFPDNLIAEQIPSYLAKKKASAYLPQLKANELLITADTIVWIDNQMLGKPIDTADAKRMLKILSGKTHQVYTAVCLTTTEKQHLRTCCTNVTFRSLSDDEINSYIDHYLPLDKAGAYGVQEWIGYTAVTNLEGSFYNVMGLPTHHLLQDIKDMQ